MEELKRAIERQDNELIHEYYDKLIYEIAKNADPKFVEKLDKLVEKATFWYA